MNLNNNKIFGNNFNNKMLNNNRNNMKKLIKFKLNYIN